jgi:hypothetical protein
LHGQDYNGRGEIANFDKYEKKFAKRERVCYYQCPKPQALPEGVK